jgi:signal transduction histidine kinase/DNA-binding response OmpR family regulator/HPt (histidine-containing phosphotransfer) domain-containing protein
MFHLLRQHLRSTLIWLLIALICASLIVMVMRVLIGQEQRSKLQLDAARETIELQSISSNGTLMGGAMLMGMAETGVKRMLRGEVSPNDPATKEELRGVLELSGADEALVLSPDGMTVAYLNREGRSPGLGHSLRGRPYWQRGMNGIPSVYPAIGINTGLRGLYFAAPVYRDHAIQSPVIGVYALKLGVDKLDQALSADEHPALLLSPTGLVFAANRPEWLLHQAFPLTAQQHQALIDSKQFSSLFSVDKPLPPNLPFDLSGKSVIIDGKTYAVAQKELNWPDNLGSWHLVMLEDTAGWLPLWPSILLFIATFLALMLLWLIPSVRRFAREEAVRLRTENTARLQAIFDVSPAAIMTMDPQGIIVFSNTAARAMFDIDESPGARQHITDFMPELTAFGGGAFCFQDCEAYGRGGVFLVESTLASFEQDGVVNWVIYLRDQTDRLRQQRELQEARDAAEAATQAKSMFLANMSHEIRTPMNAIIGLSHLALQSDLMPKQRDYIQKIHTAGNSLLGIINDILDFSKIEAGKFTIESIFFDLDAVLAHVASMTTGKAQEKNLEYLFDVPPALPRCLRGDPLRLGQVLINMINNAIKFTPRGEVLMTIRLQASAGQDILLRFSITDTGIGLTQSQIAGLFQPFTQADGSTTRQFGGTGLGLSISKRLVELMGGEIGVESAEGQGSTFWFTCRVGVASAAEAALRVLPRELDGLRVLVVDDNPAARITLLEALRDLHASAEAVDSAQAAWERLEAAQDGAYCQLLLTDWQMPGMDGIELARRALQQLAIPPRIVLVSAFGREEIRSQAEQIGVDGFLSKPVIQSDLVDTLVGLFASSVPETTARKENAAMRFSGGRVLLVEDNKINQQIARELMEAAGLEVSVAHHGKEAIERLSQGGGDAFDLVLMDLQMPVMGGIEATRLLRADPRFDDLPIIAMTAHAQEEEQQRCLDAGMNDHIAKPIRPAVFYALLARWLADRLTVVPASVFERAAAGGPAWPDAIPGIDLPEALARVNQNRVLLNRLLRSFAEEQPEVADAIARAVGAGDYPAAMHLAHTLKGVSGNLGAHGIEAHAARLEERLQAQATLAELTPALQTLGAELGDLCRALIRDLPDAHPAEPLSARQGLEAWGPDLSRLSVLMDECDPEALERFDSLAGEFAAAFGDEVAQELRQSLGRYDFYRAQSVLLSAARARGLTLESGKGPAES